MMLQRKPERSSNIQIILEASGASLNDIVDVTAFLIDMDRDFKAYNAVYAEYFTPIQATRTLMQSEHCPPQSQLSLR